MEMRLPSDQKERAWGEEFNPSRPRPASLCRHRPPPAKPRRRWLAGGKQSRSFGCHRGCDFAGRSPKGTRSGVT